MHEYTMKQFAYANGVQVSDQAIKKQAQLVTRKLATTQDYQDQIRQSAISMFPAYKTQIESGVNMRDVADPYMQMMAEELELPYQSIDLTNNLIKQALNGVSSDGKPTGLTLTDFQSQLRADPRWRDTGNAQKSVMQVSANVLREMGLLGSSAQ